MQAYEDQLALGPADRRRQVYVLATIIVAALLGGIYLVGDRLTGSPVEQPVFPGLTRLEDAPRLLRFTGASSSDPLVTNQYVSIAQYDQDRYVIANYANLLLLSRDQANICPLSPDWSGFPAEESSVPHGNETRIYNPTGVWISDGELFVANYKGNNVLRARIDIKECQVRFIGEYRSQDSLGPENVVADQSRDLVVSANYDGGTVTAFRLDTGSPIWTTKIPQAHGIALAPDSLFVTGLRDRKIFELDMHTGEVLKSVGDLGWDPASKQFLWPTAITSLTSGTVALADAQSGFVSFINPRTLDVDRHIGGNGPSLNRFNYPYSVAPADDGMVVLSTNRNHILFFDQLGSITEDFVVREQSWPDIARLAAPFGKGWVGYVDESGETLAVQQNSYKLGFGHLQPESVAPILRVPDIFTLFNFGPYIYLLQGRQLSEDVAYFFSSSSTTLLGIVRGQGKPDLLLHESIPVDTWLIGENLVSSTGIVQTERRLVQLMEKTAKKYYAIIDTEGWIPPEDLFNVGTFRIEDVPLNYVEFEDHLDRLFSSSFARRFKHTYDQCNRRSCDTALLRNAASFYYQEVNGQLYANLDEYLLVGMLSGLGEWPAADLGNAGEGWHFSGCDAGRFYDGFDTTALETESLADYVSSPDLAASVVCFGAHTSVSKVKGLRFIWHSADEAAKRVALYGLDSGDVEDRKLLGSYELTTASEGGYASSRILFEDELKFDTYRLEVEEGGRQNRLLLRAIIPVASLDLENMDEFERLVSEIHKSQKYGAGVSRLPGDVPRTPEAVREYLAQADSAHCGNFAYLYVSSLSSRVDWKVVDLETYDGRTHSVVQLREKGHTRTLDPTLGVAYRCSVDALISGTCGGEIRRLREEVNPALQMFEGLGFFYGARIVRTYSNFDELLSGYGLK
ncbi:MAG: hypothetical protein AB7O54_21590 [Pseudomonadales bacterium]